MLPIQMLQSRSPVRRDLAAKPDDPRRHAPCDPPTGRAPARALRAL